MNLTNQQIEELRGKCPECWNIVTDYCKSCFGEGKATIEIKKEWVEKQIRFTNVNGKSCFRTEKIPKYKVGDAIKIITDINIFGKEISILKILSETEDKWKVCLA